MSHQTHSALRAQLIAQLDEAYRARRGVPPSLEAHARAYAHALRLAGTPIERVLVEVKALAMERTLDDAPIFIPRIVGWTVAGYFDRAAKAPGGQGS